MKHYLISVFLAPLLATFYFVLASLYLIGGIWFFVVLLDLTIGVPYPDGSLHSLRTGIDELKRPETSDACDQIIELGKDNDETAPNIGNVNCALQHHKIPVDDGELSWDDYQKAALDGQNPIDYPNSYDLSFIELDENKLAEREPKQMELLLKSLGESKSNYVVAFVHGWRHDASIGDYDIKKFRTILAYTRATLNTRCLETLNTTKTYCDTKLTGVFIGWRGRLVNEPLANLNPSTSNEANAQKSYLWAALAAGGTIFDRKEMSETFASGKDPLIGSVLTKINAAYKKEKKDSKFLIFGHSLGGNMLATYLQGHYVEEMKAYGFPEGAKDQKTRKIAKNEDKKFLASPIGDMVLLINPAAEAYKWTSIQREVRKATLHEQDDIHLSYEAGSKLAAFDCEKARKTDPSYLKLSKKERQRCTVGEWRTYFKKGQRPIYVSITATADWHESALGGQCKCDINCEPEVKFDWATKVLFGLANRVKFYWSDKSKLSEIEHTTAIGHLYPKFTSATKITGLPFGATHDFIVNKGAIVRTAYSKAGSPRYSWCSDASGWIATARNKPIAPKKTHGARWDTGAGRDYISGPKFSTPDPADKYKNEALIQMSQTLQLPWTKEGGDKGSVGVLYSLAPKFSPFWNMRALDTGIVKHGGFGSYPLWCGINRLVLDDTTNQKTGGETSE